MAGRKFYCICDADCKFETMTKEQIIDALAAAATTAYVKNGCLYIEAGGGVNVEEDAAFITQIREGNAGGNVSVWVGTEAEFNAIAPAVKADSFVARIDESGKVYICKNDSLMELLKNTLHEDFIRVGGEDLDAQRIAELNSHDYMAGALKQAQGADSAYIDKPVQMCYKTQNANAATADTPLAIWVDKGDGATELQPLPVWQLKEWLGSYFSKGMKREFEQDVNAAVYTYNGTESRIYTVTCGAPADDSRLVTLTVDYKTISETEKTFVAAFPPVLLNTDGMAVCELVVQKTSSGVKFTSKKRTASGVIDQGQMHIKKICGYY